MKEIHAILKEIGIEVPEGEKEAFDNAVMENYKTVAEVEKIRKKVTAAEQERDNEKALRETAENALKNFEGIDPAKYQETLNAYKAEAENAKKNYEKQMLQRDQEDWINKKLDEYGVKSPYAKRQLKADIMQDESGLKWKDDAFFGFDDFMKSAKEKDSTLFKTAEEIEEEEQNNAAPRFKFTGRADGGSGSDGKNPVPQIF